MHKPHSSGICRIAHFVCVEVVMECIIIVCLTIKSLWMWSMTLWLHIVASLCYKVGRNAWHSETLCLVVIGWNPTQASIGTLWPNVLSESTIAKLFCFCVSCGQHPCFWDFYLNVEFMLLQVMSYMDGFFYPACIIIGSQSMYSTSVQSRWFPGVFWNCRGLCLSMPFLDMPYYSFNLTCIGLPVPLM